MKDTAPLEERREVGTEQSRESDLYSKISEYADSHSSITYSEFESHALKEFCLFNVPDDAYMQEIEKTLDIIIKALPSFKRIFARPIVRLKDHHEIMPIEAVKVIEKRSLSHLASRCEMWEDITKDGIKPRKLLTIEHVETYAIYENIAFAWAVDSILSFIRHALIRIKDVMYGCRDIHFNLLDHTHHNLYFLAIGKLYLEYVRSRPGQENWSRCVDKMMFVDKALRSKLSSPVYHKCKKSSYALRLKKTNIFRSHKDYAEVYKVLKHFESMGGAESGGKSDVRVDDKGYVDFCKLLTLFSIGHFNYSFKEKKKIDLAKLDLSCSFSSWQLNVRHVNNSETQALMLTTVKDREYTTAVVFCEKSRFSGEVKREFKEKHPADEYIVCSPNIWGDRDVLYLNMFDIDSFRRIQQILLRGMILSDTKRVQCAFCGGKLKEEKGKYICDSCSGVIEELVCPDTGKPYVTSGLVRLKPKKGDRNEQERRKFLHDKLDEAQLHFRNITAVTGDGIFVCPHCGKPHF